MPSGSRSFIRDHGLHQDGEQLNVTMWYKRDWATEGYRRVAAPQAGHDFDSMSFPDHHSVATQSAALSMSPQMLEAILRSSDAADFSTEELTRLQEGMDRSPRYALPLTSTWTSRIRSSTHGSNTRSGRIWSGCGSTLQDSLSDGNTEKLYLIYQTILFGNGSG